jgi:hypothetical protein
VNRTTANEDRAVLAATACAFAMIANQVAGKAVRDALFLDQFGVEALPRMVVGGALFTIGAVLLAARLLHRFGPRVLVPGSFVGSALVQFALWPMIRVSPGLAAIGLYVHMAVFSAVLISWYWSMVNERLDPNTARRRIGRIAGGGTLGGLIGGILAERVASYFAMDTMLPILGTLHLVCGAFAWFVGRGADPDHAHAGEAAEESSGLQVLARIPYLRNLGALVATTTVSAAFLDWVFKARATQIYEGESLLRFFGLFYTGVALLTFLVQTLLTRRLLTRGIGVTVSTLPLLIALGAGFSILVPGLAVAGVVRGVESATRSSLFRSSYELFFNPVPRAAKRATKTLVDVGFDRLGDATGGALVQLVLFVGVAVAQPILLGLAAALGLVGVIVARRLHRGYVGALETSLLARAHTLDPADERGRGPDSSVDSLSQLELTVPLPDLGDTLFGTISFALEDTALRRDVPESAPPAGGEAPGPAIAPAPSDPYLAQAVELRSGDVRRVQRALRSLDRPPRELTALIVPLLGWDAVSGTAIRALRSVADRDTGMLLDSLLDPEEEFAIRRRIPRVLAGATTERAADGLLRALADRRFEVRYQSGVALTRLHDRSDIAVDADRVMAAVVREARVDRTVWEGQRLLDEGLDNRESPFHDDVLRERASRSLEHVFNCLSLVYPREPLQVAYRGLYATDRSLRGTALEYLEQILPAEVRECLWPFLDADRRREAPRAGDMDRVVESLLRSHESILLDLRQLEHPSPDADAADTDPPDTDWPRTDRPGSGRPSPDRPT